METTDTNAATDPRRQAIDDDRYEEFLDETRAFFHENLAADAAMHKGAYARLFTTETPWIWDYYLRASPPEARKSRTCNACRRFLERFGGLVTIDPDGRQRPLFWKDADASPAYREAAQALAGLVAHAPVTGVFLSAEPVWGQPRTGVWTHLAATPPPALVWSAPDPARAGAAAHQRVAEKHEEFQMLRRVLAETSAGVVRQAVGLLTGAHLAQSARHVDAARWLLALCERVDTARTAKDPRRPWQNLLWRAVADAPPGFAHVRSGVLGGLLVDIGAGLSTPEIQRRHADKMHPLQYQRPTAPATDGQIEAAEKRVAELGVAKSLERRFATLADLQPLWVPPPPAAAAPGPVPGVFAHLRARPPAPTADLPEAIATWVKFRATVLPTATAIEFLVPHAANYSAFVTAAHADAPPILQWDRPERRNPVSWYLYVKGSSSDRWNLTPGAWQPVDAVVPQPSQWDPAHPQPHHGESVTFVLRGARDLAHTAGGGLFPNHLRADLHAIRAVVEAHTARATVLTAATASTRGLLPDGNQKEACGVRLQAQTEGGWGAPLTFRVTGPLGRTVYKNRPVGLTVIAIGILCGLVVGWIVRGVWSAIVLDRHVRDMARDLLRLPEDRRVLLLRKVAEED